MTAVTYDVTERAEYPVTDGITYLTGVSTELTRTEGRDDLGLLVTPHSAIHHQRNCYSLWGADNGCFTETRGKAFDQGRWYAWLQELADDLDGCLFATLPDVVRLTENGPVGDARATLERSAPHVDRVQAMGFPTALVLQDGLTPGSSLWRDTLELADAVFVGGSNDFKLGDTCAMLVAEAKDSGRWVHVGRVNSLKRLRYAQAIGADSADGTFLKYCRKEHQPAQHARMIGWLDALAAERAS